MATVHDQVMTHSPVQDLWQAVAASTPGVGWVGGVYLLMGDGGGGGGRKRYEG